MATHVVTAPDGQTYRITAPEGATDAQIMAFVRSQVAQGKTPEQPSSGGSALDALHSGLTWGWSDELGGVGARLGHGLAKLTGNIAPGRENLGPQVAEQETARQRADLAAFRERNPWTSTGIELAGSLVSGGPLAKLATAPAAAAKAAPLLPTAGRLAALGAGEGALAGAGAADENKLFGGLLGSALGGTMGGALPLAGLGLSVGGQKLGNFASNLKSRLTAEPTTRAGRVIGEYLSDAGITPVQLQSRMRQLGPQGTLIEAAGEAGTTLAQGLGELDPVRVRSVAERALGSRLGGMNQRVREAVARTTGVTERLQPSLDAVRARQVSISKPLYDAADAVEIPLTGKLKNLLARPSVKDAFSRAKRIAADQGEELPPLFKLDELGEWEKAGVMPDMKAWDRIKRGLDNIIDGEIDPVTGRMSDNGRVVSGIKRELLSELDDINPAYKRARQAFAGDAAIESAMRHGERFLTMKTRDVHSAVADLTPSEREAFLTGAVEAIREKIGRARSGDMAGFRALETDNAMEKLRAVFPPGKEGTRALADLMRSIRNERTLKETHSAVLRGSQTAPRAAAGRALGLDVADPTTAEMLNAPVRTGVLGAVNKALRAMGRESQPTVEALTDMAFSSGNAANIIAEMQRRGIPQPLIQQYLNRMTLGSAALAPAAGLFGGTLAQ